MAQFVVPEELYSMLQKGSVTSLLCREPSARNYFIDAMVSYLLKKGKNVVYLDIDSYFTSLTIKRGSMPENLTLIYPKGSEIDDAFITLLSWTKPNFDLLVIDSLTTFYHASPISNFSSKNRKLGFYLAMLREFAKRANAPVLVVSHQIFRKIGEEWTVAYSGGRLLDHHSATIIRASMEQNALRLDVAGSARNNVRRFEVPVVPICY